MPAICRRSGPAARFGFRCWRWLRSRPGPAQSPRNPPLRLSRAQQQPRPPRRRSPRRSKNSSLDARALLPVADRRDPAARGRPRHRLPADARRGAPRQGREALQARDRHRAAGPRRRPGAGRRHRLAPGVAGFAGCAALPGAAAGRPQPPRRCRGTARRSCCAPRRGESLPRADRSRAAVPVAQPRPAGGRRACSTMSSSPMPRTRRRARRRWSLSGAPGWRRPSPARRSISPRKASAADPAAEGPALLALDMLPATPEAEAIVRTQLAAQPVEHRRSGSSTSAPWRRRSGSPRPRPSCGP